MSPLSGQGQFIISLDFELLWGVRDHANRQTYGDAVLGGRRAIPVILKLFESYGIRATWATVGLLFCENREEMEAALPSEELRPDYENGDLSSYRYLSELKSGENEDPFYFGLSLLERVKETKGQEIATHTFSHFYCLENGASLQAFEADIDAALKISKKRGVEIRSIVFPRNQYSEEHLRICGAKGILAYRGNPKHWVYNPTSKDGENLVRRGMRLLDAHTGVLGSKAFEKDHNQYDPRNIPASQFLRPNSGRLRHLNNLHLRTVKKAMTEAAQIGLGYHLWWHPHNFGRNTEANLASLDSVLKHFRKLQDDYGFQSVSMKEAAS